MRLRHDVSTVQGQGTTGDLRVRCTIDIARISSESNGTGYLDRMRNGAFGALAVA